MGANETVAELKAERHEKKNENPKSYAVIAAFRNQPEIESTYYARDFYNRTGTSDAKLNRDSENQRTRVCKKSRKLHMWAVPRRRLPDHFTCLLLKSASKLQDKKFGRRHLETPSKKRTRPNNFCDPILNEVDAKKKRESIRLRIKLIDTEMSTKILRFEIYNYPC